MLKCTKSLRSSAVRKSVRFWPTQLLFNLNFYFLHNAQRTWVGNPVLNKSREPLESGHTTYQWSLHHHLPIGTRGKHGILSVGFKLQWTVFILFPWKPKTSSYPGANPLGTLRNILFKIHMQRKHLTTSLRRSKMIRLGAKVGGFCQKIRCSEVKTEKKKQPNRTIPIMKFLRGVWILPLASPNTIRNSRGCQQWRWAG